MEKRIFISHSSKDCEAANQICELLEQSGLKCWIAPRDIPFSSVWAGEISKAISDSSAFLFLSSAASNESPHVSREIQLAVESKVPIIPIHLDDTPYSDANKYYLATIHCMVEYNANKIHKLAADIIKLIPKQEEEIIPAKEEKNEKAPKKENHILRMLLCLLGCTAASAIGAFLAFFTDLNSIIRYASPVILLIIAFIPLFITRGKALKKINVNRGRVNLITCISFILSAVIILSGYFIDYSIWYKNMDDKYHITVTAPEDMSAADFITATEAVLDRLEIFAGDTKYTANVDGDKIDIIIPRELFKGENPEDVMRLYLTRSMNFYITTPEYHWGESSEEYPLHVAVTTDDIESAEIKFGSLEGVDPALLGTEEAEYEYIEVVLKKDFYDKNSNTFDQYGEKICLAMDKEEYTSFWYFDVKRDNNILYILNDDVFDNANETALHNLTHEPLKTSLYFKVDIAPVFERVEDTDNPGKLQCNADEIKGDYVTFTMKATFDDVTEGEWLNTKNEIKKRLDAIGMPYAYGTTEHEPFSAVIRTGTERMGISVMRLLTANHLNLTTDFTEIRINNYSTEFTLSTNGTDASSVTVTPDNDYDAEKFKDIAALAASSENKNLRLTADTGPGIFSCAAEIDSDTSAITFSEVALTGNTKLDESTMWIADLTKAIFDTNKATYLTFGIYEFSSSDMTEKDFGVSLNLDELETTVKENYPDSYIDYSGKNLSIELKLPVDEKLPEKLIEAGKIIYQSIDFENCIFDSIAIYAIDEIKEERARIFFRKQIYSIYVTDDFKGYVYVHGIFSGGRIERDHDRFIELVYADKFYKPFIHEDDGIIAFDP